MAYSENMSADYIDTRRLAIENRKAVDENPDGYCIFEAVWEEPGFVIKKDGKIFCYEVYKVASEAACKALEYAKQYASDGIAMIIYVGGYVWAAKRP